MKNSDLRGRIHSFETFGAVDGPGMRFVVFFQGCPLRCVFCHNPDTWDPSGGTEYTVEQVVQRVLPYREFYRGGGVTLSGGEPLAQHEFAAGLMERLRSEGLHTALDTSAGVPLDLCRTALEQADMLLLDFKGFSSDLSRRLTGREGVLSREKEYLEYCEERGKTVWVRYVLVPGMTMDREMLRALGDYLRGFKCVEKTELLPFHKLGEHKWQPGLYTLGDTPAPTKGEISAAWDALNGR